MDEGGIRQGTESFGIKRITADPRRDRCWNDNQKREPEEHFQKRAGNLVANVPIYGCRRPKSQKLSRESWDATSR